MKCYLIGNGLQYYNKNISLGGIIHTYDSTQ